jgi:D-glycero-D-manno-heptose 1,7-bisphosphate phosphatase
MDDYVSQPNPHPSDLRPAIFLDRDGVLIEDAGLVTKLDEIHILPNVSETLEKLHQAGYILIIISNQAVVARGLLTESQVMELEQAVEDRLGMRMDGFYFCPHHPQATLIEYRVACECRKPRPGLIFQAAGELRIDRSRSFMVGDRPTDILAGTRAGCRTIWVHTGQHFAAPIQTDEELGAMPVPDCVCSGLPEAATWILEHR